MLKIEGSRKRNAMDYEEDNGELRERMSPTACRGGAVGVAMSNLSLKRSRFFEGAVVGGGAGGGGGGVAAAYASPNRPQNPFIASPADPTLVDDLLRARRRMIAVSAMSSILNSNNNNSNPNNNNSSSSNSMDTSQSSSSSLLSAAAPSNRLFTEEEVKAIVDRALVLREEQLRQEYDVVLHDKLAEQYMQFAKFNEDYLSRQIKQNNNFSHYVS